MAMGWAYLLPVLWAWPSGCSEVSRLLSGGWLLVSSEKKAILLSVAA